MRKIKIILFNLLIFIGFSLNASVELRETNINAIFNKVEEGYHTFEDGSQVWGVKLWANPDSLADINFISQDSYKLITENDVLKGLFLYRTDSVVEFTKSAQPGSWNFTWKPETLPGVEYLNCGRGAPRLAFIKNAEPIKFYIRMSCAMIDNKNYMTLTYDPRADLEYSSVFELSGKGEAYKHFEVPFARPGSVFGKLIFNFENQKFEVGLYLTKTALTEAAVVRNVIMFGTANMGVSSSDFSTTQSKYTLNYEFLSAPVISNLQLGGQAYQSFALSSGSGESDLNRTWVTGYLHYEFLKVNTLLLAARLIGGLLSFQDSISGLNLTSFQLGYGLNLQYDLDSQHRFIFGLDKVGMMSETVKDHMALSLHYQYQLQNGQYIGLGYISNSFQAVNASGIVRNLTSNDMLLTFGF